MLFCFFFFFSFFFFFLIGSVTLTRSLTATISKKKTKKKTQNHGFLQFLNSVSSLRHLPNSAVKNGTNVAHLLLFYFSFLWSFQCHQVQVLLLHLFPQEINTGKKKKKSNISVRTIFKSPGIYFVIEMLFFASVESWNMSFFFFFFFLKFSCTPQPHCNGVIDFLWSCEVLRY